MVITLGQQYNVGEKPTVILYTYINRHAGTLSFLFCLCPRMAINVIVQYNGGFLPDILLLTQTPIFVWFDGTTIVCYYYPLNYVFYYVWWLCMAINISVEYNGGFLPDIILLTQGYYHQGTRLNIM